MADIVIRLTPQELATARRDAGIRQHKARAAGARAYGLGSVESHTLGRLGEIAVNRYLGSSLPDLSWLQEKRQHFDTPPPGGMQVRACRQGWQSLTYRDGRDCPWCPYVSTLVPDLAADAVILRGWATGEQIQAEGRLIEKTGFPFYALSPHLLHPLPPDPHPYFYLDQTICRKMAG